MQRGWRSWRLRAAHCLASPSASSDQTSVDAAPRSATGERANGYACFAFWAFNRNWKADQFWQRHEPAKRETPATIAAIAAVKQLDYWPPIASDSGLGGGGPESLGLTTHDASVLSHMPSTQASHLSCPSGQIRLPGHEHAPPPSCGKHITPLVCGASGAGPPHPTNVTSSSGIKNLSSTSKPYPFHGNIT